MLPEHEPTPRTRSVRVILADDHDLARSGLRAMLATEPGLEVIGEAANGREALELCRQLQPDLALLDVRMPEMDGLSAARAITQASPGTRILIVTMQDSTEYLLQALQAGASGYVLKDATRRELISAVRQVLGGGSSIDPALASRTLQGIAGRQSSHPAAPVERLTPRELEVLRLLAQGLTNRGIADRLVVSVGTVKVHVERIIAKLGVVDRTQAAVRALELGLLASAAS